jgi:hypothetical protein
LLTVLHDPAEREEYSDAGPNYALLLAQGADRSIRDNNGKRSADLLARSLVDVVEVLTPT